MQPVVRTLHVLRAVAFAPNGITLQELSRQLGIPVGSMHRMLKVLATEQFIVRSEASKRYFVGPATRDLVSAGGRAATATTIVHPALSKLGAATGETAFITEFVEHRAVCVSLVTGRHRLRLFVHVGQEMPLHAAASARVLLSDLNDDEAAALLDRRPLLPYTPDTPRTTAEALRRLAVIRQRGYDVCDQELDPGVWAVAAPVRQADGRMCAAVSLASPIGRAPDAPTRNRLTELVLAAAQQIAATQR
ncbi:IclR family transcriptional regulator [Dactylosporangium sp. NPDC051541]|uniref:IclR family transcriptional regulator n=1 Tax=Dactylosporangium sp. NPDC051541 TaxID=3363977 RepID=UPI003792EF94